MLHARLREIRKAKGMTLQEVAERVRPQATTAQTIGRLETGVRTLTVDWVRRIAEAMDVDPAELLSLPAGGDIAVEGAVTAGGGVVLRQEGVLSVRLLARDPLAVRLAETMGQYRSGDVVVCERLEAEHIGRAVGADCLVEDEAGRRHFAKVVPGTADGAVTLAPLGPTGTLKENVRLAWAAPAVALMRQLAR